MRKFLKLFYVVPCASLFFVSCVETTFNPARLLVANMVVNPPVSPVTPTSLPTPGTAVDVRWGGNLALNNVVYGAASVITGTPITTINSFTSIVGGYATVKSGAMPLNLAVAGSSPGTTVYNRITSFLPDRSYTAVALDVNPFYRVMIMEDDLSAPPTGKAKLRFVHAISPLLLGSLTRKDTIDVTAYGGLVSAPLNNANIFPLRAFADGYTNKNLQQFALIDSGSYNIAFRVAGTPGTAPATGLLGFFPSPTTRFRFESGKIYTIVARLQITATAAPTPATTFITHN
jgi:Domain of unknown function (DUF4397)